MVGRLLLLLICVFILGHGSGKKEAEGSTLDSDGIFRLSHKSTNIYLVTERGRHLLIDAGYESSFSRIEAFLDDHGVDRSDLEYLVLTHAHVDHAGAAKRIREEYGCQVIAGGQDSTFYVNGINVDICPTSLTARILSWFTKDRYAPVKPDIWITSSDTLRPQNFGMEIFNLPGHTPGSLIIKKDESAFVGDLIRGRPLDHDRPAIHYFMCDLNDNEDDIRGLLRDTSVSIWYPGHFGPLQVFDVRSWANYR